MFTQMQTSPTNELCRNILNEAGLFVLNIYKWSFKHGTGRTSLKSLQNTTRKRLPGDNSSSAANEQRKGDNKHVFFFKSPGISRLIQDVRQDLLWFGAVQRGDYKKSSY